MHKIHHPFAILALICLLSADALAEPAKPVPTEPVDDRAAVVPSVPLPAAFYGSLASVAIMVVLWNSRHRSWLTLR